MRLSLFILNTVILIIRNDRPSFRIFRELRSNTREIQFSNPLLQLGNGYLTLSVVRARDFDFVDTRIEGSATRAASRIVCKAPVVDSASSAVSSAAAASPRSGCPASSESSDPTPSSSNAAVDEALRQRRRSFSIAVHASSSLGIAGSVISSCSSSYCHCRAVRIVISPSSHGGGSSARLSAIGIAVAPASPAGYDQGLIVDGGNEASAIAFRTGTGIVSSQLPYENPDFLILI